MKARVLAGVTSAILLPASVVVGFLQHDAFVTLKSNNLGNRHVFSNTFKMVGTDPSDLPTQQFFGNLPTWGAVAAGTLLIIAASRREEEPLNEEVPGVSSGEKEIESTSATIGGLTDELGTLQSRMKILEATGLDLDKQLKNTQKKLTQRELDISKARLEATDQSLALNQEIDSLKQKLETSDSKAQKLSEELSRLEATDQSLDLNQEIDSLKQKLETSDSKAQKLGEELSRLEATDQSLDLNREIDSLKQKLEASDSKAQKLSEELSRLEATDQSLDLNREIDSLKQGLEASNSKTETLSHTLSIARGECARLSKELEESKEEQARKSAVAETPRASGSGVSASSDLTTLTKSALSRTTVKVLVDFLESRGVATCDESGKTLKKALLIDAVRSL